MIFIAAALHELWRSIGSIYLLVNELYRKIGNINFEERMKVGFLVIIDNHIVRIAYADK